MRPVLTVFSLLLCSTPALADAGADIDRGNRDWATAVVQGNPQLEADAYSADAVFCDAKGSCTTGHDAIEALMADRLNAGHAKSAEAHSTRRVVDDGFVYEWGEARLVAADGKQRNGRYFTVWKQEGGRWKIFRNLVLP